MRHNFADSMAAWDPDLSPERKTSTPATPVALPHELSGKIAEYLTRTEEDPDLRGAFIELGTFITNNAGMQSQKDRFGGHLNLLQTRLQEAVALLRTINGIDGSRTDTHNRIAAVDTQQLPGGVIVDEDRLEGFSDDGHHCANE